MRTKRELYQEAMRTVALRRQAARANAEDARAEAKPVDEEDGQRHQRVGGADGGKGVLADEFAHDDAVYGVVGELEQVAQHKGNGEIDQQRGNGAGRHVFGHRRFLLK